MTAVVAGQRVRLRASVNVFGGKVGVVSKRLVSSKRWRILLDERDSFGRQLQARCTDDELLPEDPYFAWLANDMTLDQYLTADPLPALHERITFAPTADGGLRVVWVTVNDDNDVSVIAAA